MSRENKYRAWSNKSKAYHSWDEIMENTVSDGYPSLNELFDNFYCNLIPEQYTGLEDKNGTEIYEGDILNDFSGRVLHIFYCETHCRLEFNSLNTEPFKGVQAFEWFDDFTKKHNDLPLIIGNIRENKELLT